jgi:hypothetical protein
MENDNKQAIVAGQNGDTSSGTHVVIQPSRSFVEEMKATQPVTPITPQTTPTSSDQHVTDPTQTPLQVNNLATSQPPSTPSSVYPEVTRGIGAMDTATTSMSQSEPVPGPKLVQKTSPKIIVIKLVAGIIILLNAVNFYDWLLELHAGYTNWISALEIIAIVTLAIGIFKLSETARSIYIVVSAISLVLSCVGLITFYVSTRHVDTVSSSQPVTRAHLESDINFIENDKGLPPQTKQKEIQQIQKEINNLPTSHTDLVVKQYLSTAMLILTAVGPIIFFTRPSIKEAFN